jgi:hypothetical protein
MDACYRSAKTKRWEPVKLERWLDAAKKEKAGVAKRAAQTKYALIKEERMPNGKIKQILRDPKTGKIIQKIKA